MTIRHSRLSFGQAVRRAKRAGTLRYYRRTARERIAVLDGGDVLRLACLRTRREDNYDGPGEGEAWAGRFAENH